MGGGIRKEGITKQLSVNTEQRLAKSLKIMIGVLRLKCIFDRTLRKLKAYPPPLASMDPRTGQVLPCQGVTTFFCQQSFKGTYV